MYRINRIFVSEIVAGDNILRNGFIPVFRQGGLADHGVLFAANGTCKTTLLSFILSVFCPGRQRFVQHLQSGGDKSLEQYLIPGRPAIVLIDLVINRQATLFDANTEGHLVLGQLLYRHRSMPDKVERLFFIAESAEFFDEIRTQWDELLATEQPYRIIRDFMRPRIQQTTSQKEWADKLEQLGLDPWLIDRQVDFARTEGGIKDAFKFGSELDFLSFFLGCVTDLEAATILRERIGQDLRKMQERPRKIGQLKVVRTLKQQIADFDAIALDWRNTGKAIDGWRLQLGEATHLLREADRGAERAVVALAPDLEKAQSQHVQTGNDLEIVVSNILAVKQFQLQGELTEKTKRLEQSKGKIKEVVYEKMAIKAADFIADIHSKNIEAVTKQEALSMAGQEITPMSRKVNGLAARYHFRLDADRQLLEKDISHLNKQQDESKVVQQALEQKQKDELVLLENLEKKRSQLNSRINEAVARRGGLVMEPGESPLEAQARLRTETEALSHRITRLTEEIQATDDAAATANDRLVGLQGRDARLEAEFDQAREWMEKEAAERTLLSADQQIIRVAGMSGVDVTSAGLLSRLDGAISRTRNRLEDETRSKLELEHILKDLDRTKTLAADDQTQKLISHYHQGGIEAGDLKSYPEYLASLYDNPEQIAVFIESDPARFTGIMAATQTVIDKVKEIPAPSWMYRPVIISTPCAVEDVLAVEHVVIRPPSPDVYSKSHMEKVKAGHLEKVVVLVQKIEKTATLLQEMEKSSRALHNYQEKYPDRTAVATLSERVDGLKNDRIRMLAEIGQAEAEGKALRKSKSNQENRYRLLGDDAAGLQGLLTQVQGWLTNYAELDQWQKKEGDSRIESETMEKTIGGYARTLEAMKESRYKIEGDIKELKAQFKFLDEKAGELLKPSDITLTADDQEEALSMDAQTLRRLHGSARDDLRRLSSDLGVDTLQKELEVLQGKIAAQESRFKKFRREDSYDEVVAVDWAGRSQILREERQQVLGAEQSSLTDASIRLESEITFQKENFEKISVQLSRRQARGIMPNLTDEELAEHDSDAFLRRLREEERKISRNRERLVERCTELERKLKSLQTWHQEIKLCLAEHQHFEPVWDEDSPRCQWPELLIADKESVRLLTIEQLHKDLQKMATSEKEDRKAMEKARSRMSRAFDRFQGEIQGEVYRKDLPAMVDVLRSHDADSLGQQAGELILRCEDIARNFETDLDMTQRFMDSLVDMLLQHSREYHQKIQAAAREVLPEDVFIYGGKPILKAGARLDFTKHHDAFRQSVENWLYELMQQDRLPEVNPKVGNRLGAELLYQLLGAASGKTIFGIRLLKCDDSGSKYEPVGKDLGSGGEALTIAVLLYALLISMRKKRRGSSDGKIPAFLILDNPLGVCNRSDFLDTQLKVASGMGLQCVYLTGINDRESLDLFELRVVISRGDKQLEIDGKVYNCLDVTELNVEKEHGQHTA
ncbi:MAG: hypothetical protein COA36_17525 [Desulfotalea sp.]|nr:MAG: hypothetical protein COA36_17525 [Desulfotalea sp.]